MALPGAAAAQTVFFPVPCDPARQETAAADMESMLEGLQVILEDIESGDFAVQSKSVRWLGAVSAEDLDVLSEVFQNILAFEGIVSFLCVPQPPEDGNGVVIAYVHPAGLTVYLLDVYFGLSDTGAYSRPNTLVHELSHLFLMGGTNSLGGDDEVYGPEAAEALALEDPERAQRNASNYAMFYEDVLHGLE